MRGDRLKGCRVAGSSLAESVIAMAIVAICLVVITTVLSSVVSNTAPVSLYKGRQVVKMWAQETTEQKLFKDDQREGAGYKITREVAKQSSDEYLITFTLDTGVKKEQYTYTMYE